MTAILGTQSIFSQFGKMASLGGQTAAGATESFGDVLKDTLQTGINQMKANEKMTSAHALGEADVTQLTTDTAKLSVNIEVYTALREKLLGAYQELVKMSI